jgi:hypothetical protein
MHNASFLCAFSQTTYSGSMVSHYGRARPRVADAGDGLQIWRVPANILDSHGEPTTGGLPA